jgi:hypothetical protein
MVTMIFFVGPSCLCTIKTLTICWYEVCWLVCISTKYIREKFENKKVQKHSPLDLKQRDVLKTLDYIPFHLLNCCGTSHNMKVELCSTPILLNDVKVCVPLIKSSSPKSLCYDLVTVTLSSTWVLLVIAQALSFSSAQMLPWMQHKRMAMEIGPLSWGAC